MLTVAIHTGDTNSFKLGIVMPDSCPYCSISREDAWFSNDHAKAMPHRQPVSRFHFVIASARHVQAFYDLDVQEQRAIWGIVGDIQKRLAAEMRLEGFHIGFEDCPSSEDHAVVHVIPGIAGEHLQLPAEIEWVYTEAS